MPQARSLAQHRAPSPAALQRQCDDFNAKYTPGTRIRVRKVKGEPETMIRTISLFGASVLGGHSAVVYVTDGGGCWALDHVVEVVTE